MKYSTLAPLIMLLTASFFVACEKEITPPSFQRKPQWVVHSMLTPDDTVISVTVGVSTPAFLETPSSPDWNFATTQVTLSANNGPHIPLTYNPQTNSFISTHPSLLPITPQKHYQLSITGEYGTAWAECTIIEPQPITVSPPNVINIGDEYQVVFAINSPETQHKYYYASAELIYETNSSLYNQYISRESVTFLPFSNINQSGQTLLVRSQRDWLNTTSNIDSVEITLYQIDRNIYNYLNTLFKQHESKDLEPFVEPVMITSNIHNGVGVFGSWHARTTVFPYQ